MNGETEQERLRRVDAWVEENRPRVERERRAKEIVASADLLYVRLADQDWRDDDCHSYEVRVGGVVAGKVEAYRSESWGTNRSGKIRTHYYGNPKRWEPVIPGEHRSRVGHDTRTAAAIQVVEAALEAGKIA